MAVVAQQRPNVVQLTTTSGAPEDSWLLLDTRECTWVFLFLDAPCCSWAVLAAAGCFWLPLGGPKRFCVLLPALAGAPGSSRLLLVVAGFSWLFLAAPGYFWGRRGAAWCSWVLLGDPSRWGQLAASWVSNQSIVLRPSMSVKTCV